jgi:hypothetical protein
MDASFDALSFDLRRSGYLRGPDHRNPQHLEQLAMASERDMKQPRDARTNSDVESSDGSVAGEARPIGSLRGPDHRRM